MAVAYAYSPKILPPLAAALLLAVLSLYSWRRRAVPGALPLAAGSLFATLWLLGMASETAAVTPATKIAWHKFQAVLQLPTVTASAFFALEYAQPGRWLKRRNLILVSIPSLLVLVFVLVDNSQLMWRRMELDPDGSVAVQYAIPGAILVVFGVGLIAVNFAALIWLFAHSPQHRWPVVILLSGGLVARGFYVLSVMRVPVAVDPITLTFAVIWIIYAVVLFGFHIFSPLASARHALIEQMQAGVVVFDAGWRVASLNPAAESMLGIREEAAKGRIWQGLALQGGPLPRLTEIDVQNADATIAPSEFSLGYGQNTRLYAPTLSILRDFRGMTAGYLLTLRDVTDRRREQMQMVEQQRMLAALHERERLARELHDSIGQVLAYAGFQADAARQLIDSGQSAEAARQLDRLSTVLQDAHADVREHILNLSVRPDPQQSFSDAVQQYVDSFTSNYDCVAELAVTEGLDGGAVSPDVQVQLLRILQEALSNARKHGRARRAQVTIEGYDGRVRMSVADDGCGFEVGSSVATGDSHLGLRFMRERVEELGGNLQVDSSPGSGTRVIVEVPREED